MYLLHIIKIPINVIKQNLSSFMLDILSKNINKLVFYFSIICYFVYISQVKDVTNSVIYVIYIFIFSNLVTFESFYFEKKIQSDGINYLLLKPYQIFINRFINEGIKNILAFLLCLAEVIIIGTCINKLQFLINILVHNNMFLSMLLLTNGVIISFNLYLISCFTYFWIENQKIVYAYRLIFSFLSGLFFPLYLIPESLFEILKFTPFPYIIYIPFEVLILNHHKNSIGLIITSTVWVIFVYVVRILIWKMGIEYYNDKKNT